MPVWLPENSLEPGGNLIVLIINKGLSWAPRGRGAPEVPLMCPLVLSGAYRSP